ncbi:MAG: LytR C-terminal domain-containing protein [Candidatus Ancillula sp.]|jgi:hypothetical protein|nr:LytR C-terminal domain-containing protein [Candidatus Ancillula sp.]
MSSRNLYSEYAIEKRKNTFTFSVGVFVTVFLLVIYFTLALLFTKSTENFSSQSTHPLPCIDDNVLPIAPSEVSVRVLNGTMNAGLADAVANALTMRGFSVVETNNANMIVNDTQIRFGENATAAAYTVAGNFIEPTIVLDNRTDGLIDIVVGRTFDDLVEQDLATTLDRSKPMVVPKYCKPIKSITPVAALNHDASQIPAYKYSGIEGSSSSTPSDSPTTAHDDSGNSQTAIDPNAPNTHEAWAPPVGPE